MIGLNIPPDTWTAGRNGALIWLMIGLRGTSLCTL